MMQVGIFKGTFMIHLSPHFSPEVVGVLLLIDAYSMSS